MCRRIKQFLLSCQGAGIDRLDWILLLVAGGLRDGSLAQQIVEDDIRHNRLQRLQLTKSRARVTRNSRGSLWGTTSKTKK